MNKLINENNDIIKEIEMKISELNIDEMESTLIDRINAMESIEECENICSEKGLYEAKQQLNYYSSRINAVNEKIINENEQLKNRLQHYLWQSSMPCSVELMDLPINSSIYTVQLFYRKLQEKYFDKPMKFMILGLVQNTMGRTLNINSLEKTEKFIAKEIDYFINYISIRNLYNDLINVAKGILFNHLNQEEDDDENRNKMK